MLFRFANINVERASGRRGSVVVDLDSRVSSKPRKHRELLAKFRGGCDASTDSVAIHGLIVAFTAVIVVGFIC